MPKYVIERDMPGAGGLDAEQLCGAASRSNEVLAEMAPHAQWLHSYVTGDKLFCVYIADGPETIRAHAEAGGFPVTAIHRVVETIDPTTADAVQYDTV